MISTTKAMTISRASIPSRAGAEEERWQAVTSRDAAADGSFVFGVTTTGIYCRPSCAARRPLRKNVEFFATASDAERSGLRACLRCKPNDATVGSAAVVERLCRFIEENAGEKVTLESLSRKAAMSPFHLQKVFKRLMGVSPRQYLEAHRFKTLKRSLPKGSVTDASYEAGFSSSSRVYGTVRKRLGMSPRKYAAGAAGEQIRYTVTGTKLGRVLLAASDIGLCGVQFVDDDADLEQVLRAEYPLANFIRDDRSLTGFVKAVQKTAEGTACPSTLPIDIRGTAFQQKVWHHLQTIPAGATRTYSEVAAELGNPAAVRAVASACAANRLAMVVPCHRVTHKTGSATRYRWGAQRKQELLKMERAR